MLKKSFRLLILSTVLVFAFSGVSYALDAPSNLKQQQNSISYPVGTWFNSQTVTFWMNKPPYGWNSYTGVKLYIYNLDTSNQLLPQTSPDNNNWAALDVSIPDGRYRWSAQTYTYYGEVSWISQFPGNSPNPASDMDFGIDTTPPNGSISINNGSQFTNDPNINIDLSGVTDNLSGPKDMQFDNFDGNWSSPPELFAPSKSWTLSPGSDGPRTVRAYILDKANNPATFQDDIILDTTDPEGSISINNGAAYTNDPNVTLSLPATDNLSGLLDMQIGQMIPGAFVTTYWIPYQSSYPWTLPSGDGSKVVEVLFRDNAGNDTWTPSAWGDSNSIILDTTPPETTIDSGPSGWINTNSGFFVFSGSDTGSGVSEYQFRFVGVSGWTSGWTTLTGRTTEYFSNLPEDTWTFEIKAKDTAGNVDPTPASRTFQVDTIAPETSIDSGPSGLINTNSAAFTFSGTDAGSGGLTYSYQFDGGGWSSYSGSTSANFSSLPEGNHTFEVRAKDTAGNVDPTPASRTFQVDTIAPQTILIGPGSITNVNYAIFTFSGNDGGGSGGLTYSYQFDGGGWSPYSSSTSANLGGLSEGNHTFEVRAKDAAQNVDATPARIVFQVDTIAPETSIDSGPSGWTNTNSAAFTFSGTDGGSGGLTYSYQFDGGGWSPYSASTSANLSGLSEGNHTFEVRAKDAAQNVDATPARIVFQVDTIAPETTINSGPSSTIDTNSATFNFSGTDTGGSGITEYLFKLDGSSWTSTALTSVTLNNLSAGNHTFEVKAKDAAGNEDLTAASRTFTYAPPGSQQTVLNTLLSLSAKPKVIKKGKATTIKGQLKDIAGQPVVGKKVVLKQKVFKKIKKRVRGKIKIVKKWIWRKIATLTTDSKGNFAKKLKPKATTIFKAEFSGDSGYKAANSKAVKVTVKKAKKRKKR